MDYNINIKEDQQIYSNNKIQKIFLEYTGQEEQQNIDILQDLNIEVHWHFVSKKLKYSLNISSLEREIMEGIVPQDEAGESNCF
uniref:Uncharacterized protein n=1 Tax=Arion vulgaris TaxID=1028688 RepID=A0A0B6ZNZ5_9EUPU